MGKQRSSQLMIVVTKKQQSTFAAGSRVDGLVEDASDALADLGEALKRTGARFVSALEGAGPDEVQLELNVSLEAEGNWIVVSGKAGATAGVTMTWKRREG